jgi:outer membrane protein assembly factor BamD
MRLKTLLITLTALLALASCKTEFTALLESNDIPTKYAKAFELFEAKKYSRAAEMFESLTVLTSGLPQDDTVQFYWGLSNYKYADYVTAEGNFEKFIDVYPSSPFTEQAKFLRLDCLYRSTYRYELDQQPTYRALTAISQFILENKNSEYIPRCREMLDDLKGRLELKAYKGAWLYYHMEDYLAAHYALKNVLKENADNRYREDILYFTAMSSYKYALNSVPSKQRERYMTFVDDYFNVISEFPENVHRKELDGLYAKAQKFISKTPEATENTENNDNIK